MVLQVKIFELFRRLVSLQASFRDEVLDESCFATVLTWRQDPVATLNPKHNTCPVNLIAARPQWS